VKERPEVVPPMPTCPLKICIEFLTIAARAKVGS